MSQDCGAGVLSEAFSLFWWREGGANSVRIWLVLPTSPILSDSTRMRTSLSCVQHFDLSSKFENVFSIFSEFFLKELSQVV